jgi:hypothetical protein
MFVKRYALFVILVITCTELVLFAMTRFFGLEPDPKVGIATYMAIPLLVITVFELMRNLRLQRAAFIKDYVSQFFTDAELYQAFHDLVYTYTTAKFAEVEKIRREKNLDSHDKPVFEPFKELQGDRGIGRRFYHPALFQGSLEERRLDALLGYFDVIAYYYAKGFLRIEDIIGSIGYFLAVMQDRPVIKEYMRVNKEAWQSPEYRTMGVTPPFSYLRRLLADVETYNRKFESKIRLLQERQLR